MCPTLSLQHAQTLFTDPESPNPATTHLFWRGKTSLDPLPRFNQSEVKKKKRGGGGAEQVLGMLKRGGGGTTSLRLLFNTRA